MAQKESIQRLKAAAEERLSDLKVEKKNIEQQISSATGEAKEQLALTLDTTSEQITDLRSQLMNRNFTMKKIEKVIAEYSINKDKLSAKIKNYSIIFFDNDIKLNTLLSICSLIDLCFPHKLPQLNLYRKTILLMEDLKLKDWLNKYILWELFLLSEIGFGLDLKQCTISGSTENLIYISPNSGKAVSSSVGNKYHDKLFKLPVFFLNSSNSYFSNSKYVLKSSMLLNPIF